MSRLWKKIPPAEAQIHPLYGVKNWLAVFAFGVLLGGLRELGALNGEAHKAGLTFTELLAIDHPAIAFAKLSLWLNAGVVALIYWALLTKTPKFRLIASSLLLASWPLSALLGLFFPFDGLGEALAFSLFPWIVSCGVWVTYLNRSRRVRVTFENQVLEGETTGAVVPAPSSKPTTSSTQARLPMPVATELPARTRSTPPNRQEATSMTKPMALSHLETEEDFWAAALQEVEGPTRKAGLWAKAFALANGNEAEAKAAYLRERVLQIEQQSKEAAENHERQLAEVAEAERQAFREKLGENGAELLDCIQFIRLNTYKTPTKVFINVVRLLGGRVEWGSTGVLSSGWIVALKGNSLTLRDDDELSVWFLKSVLPMAESAFPHQAIATTMIGSCPSCNAAIPLNAVNCLGCQAAFGPGAAWKPIPRGEA